MSDHEINVKVKLDDSEAQKKLNDLTKKERKIDIGVDKIGRASCRERV